MVASLQGGPRGCLILMPSCGLLRSTRLVCVQQRPAERMECHFQGWVTKDTGTSASFSHRLDVTRSGGGELPHCEHAQAADGEAPGPPTYSQVGEPWQKQLAERPVYRLPGLCDQPLFWDTATFPSLR